MSHSARYVKGQWNANCDRCGFTYLAEELRLEWDGFMVCPKCWETRQPQDFVRAKVDIQAPPWTRPEPTDVYVFADTTSAIPSYFIAGAAIPGNASNPGQVPQNTYYPINSTSTLPGVFTAGIAIPGTSR